MELILIRHGRTEANELRLYCGRTDLPLSENGAAEILSLKTERIYPDADLFFTSGLLRADQTLGLLYGNVPRTVIREIAEYDFGLFEMKGYDELKERADYQAWINDESGEVPCPGGESASRFAARTAFGYDRIITTAERAGARAIAVVCHGGVIVRIMERLFNRHKSFYEWQPEPGRGYMISLVSEQLHEYKKI